MITFKQKIENYIETIGRVVLIGMSLGIPLFLWNGLSSFDLAKVTFLRISTLILLALWVLKITLKNEYKFFKTPLDLPILAFLIISILATIYSVHPFMSLMGSYKRYDGLTSTINYVLLYYLTMLFLTSDRGSVTSQWSIKWLIISINIAGALAALCGCLQSFWKIDLTGWGGEGYTSSTFGNPNFLGGYLAMSFFMALCIFFYKETFVLQKKKKKSKNIQQSSNQNRYLRILIIIGAISFILIFINLLMTKHRGGILGFLGAGVLFLFLVGKDIFLTFRKRLLFSIIALFITGLCLCLNPNTSPITKFTGTIKTTQEKGQEKENISFSGSAESRIYIWRTSLRIIKDHLFLGVGPDNLRLVSTQYENADFIRVEGGRNTLIDKAHNEILDMAISRGILGLLAYLWILVTIYIYGWRVLKMVEGFYKIVIAGVLSVVTSYVIQNQVGFGVVATTSLFWLLIGTITPISRLSNEKIPEIKFSLPFVIRWIICLCLIIGCISGIRLSIKPYISDIYYKNGLASANSNNIDNAIASYEKALEYYREEFYYGDILSAYNIKAKQEPYVWLDRLIDKANEAIKVNPLHPYYYNILSSAYGERFVRGDKASANKAIAACKQALKLKPLFADPYNNLAAIYVQQGKYELAIMEMEQASAIFPQDANYLRILGELHQAIGNISKAIEYFQKAIKSAPENPESYTKLGKIYFDQARFEQSEIQFQKALKLNPKDIVALNNLGTIYLKSGRRKEASLQFKAALIADPNNSYAQQMFIEVKE